MVDFSSINGAVTFDKDVDLIMQQVEILLDTHNGEVLGDYDFGTSLDRYIHNTNIGNQTISQAIQNYIRSNVELFGWNLEVNVEFLVGTMNDIMLVKIMFSKDGDIYEKTYKVSNGAIEY